MDYISLIYSVLAAILAFGYYKIYKWWSSGRDENPNFFKPSTTIGKIKDWIIIISLAITSIVFLFKSF
ncbi:hypothetical protein [Flavobacterium sp.]|uniref:hypothetical protein n=1 Tax=Flavobacterium sp. TaxID=239 RepID=UPI0025C3CB4A|nr:hypothetical protein [Flavobacterium sp.]